MKRLLLLTLALMVSIAPNVYADSLKVGVINLDTVLFQAPLAKSYNDKISAQFKPRQDALNQAQAKLQADLDKLNYNGYTMTPADRTTLQGTINDEKRSFDSMSAALQKDLAAAQAQYSGAIMSKLNDVIKKIASDGHYDLIQSSANVLYLNTAIDLTSQVIQQLK